MLIAMNDVDDDAIIFLEMITDIQFCLFFVHRLGKAALSGWHRREEKEKEKEI